MAALVRFGDMTGSTYAKGLCEVAPGVHAYLQPDGSWGYSNAGLVTGEGESLLVDTLFDLALTGEMLEAMESVTRAHPISVVVNTHANGDHCYGNSMLAGTRVVSSARSAREMSEVPPAALAALKQMDFGEDGNRFVARAFGPFDFAGIDAVAPTETFSGSMRLELGAREVELIEVGPAHTAGDVIVHVPDAGVVFTGDILFLDSTPIIWAGPVASWLAACSTIRELGPDIVVPGHGPVTDLSGLEPLEAYLRFVRAEAADRYARGMTALEAAFDIDLGEFGALLDSERLVINVDAVYRELDPSHDRLDFVTMMTELGRFSARRG